MTENNIFLAIKAAIVTGCTAFSVAFGWLGWLVVAWVLCMAIDWITGSAAAAATGEWSSAKARSGIWHKAGMIAVVLVAALADAVLSIVLVNVPALQIAYSCLLTPLVLVWYIFTELGSIAENAASMGAPVPAWLVKMLAAAKKAADTAADKAQDAADDFDK